MRIDITEIFCYVYDFARIRYTNSIIHNNDKSGPESRLNRSEVITMIIGY